MGNRPVGALRASIGVPTTVADVDRLIEFVESLAYGRLQPAVRCYLSAARAPVRMFFRP